MGFLETTLICVCLLGTGESQIHFTGPGWYRLALKDSRELTLKVSEAKADQLFCTYQGVTLSVTKDQIRSAMPLAEFRKKNPGGLKLSAAREESVRDALEELAALDRHSSRSAYRLLEKEFPACRPIIHEVLRHREKRVRRLALKLLGEQGRTEKDLEAIRPLLVDSESTVRLAAVMALRQFGPAARDALLDFLESEPVVNNRRIAVKSLERFNDTRAAAPLVRLLETEKDRGVRRAVARALGRLTKKDFGDDPVAWKKYLTQVSNEEQMKKISSHEPK